MKIRTMGIEWNLRRLMAERGLYSTTDLQPLLRARGVELSATQVYRLVTQTPERLNMRVLAAVCDALECTPNELIEVSVSENIVAPRAVAAGERLGGRTGPSRPKRVRVVRED
jgi:DNA-binding Xre family transcriptional regulator